MQASSPRSHNKWPNWDLSTSADTSRTWYSALYYFVHNTWILFRDKVMSPLLDMQVDS